MFELVSLHTPPFLVYHEPSAVSTNSFYEKSVFY